MSEIRHFLQNARMLVVLQCTFIISVGSFVILCHFLVKAKTRLILKEDIVTFFKKIRCQFFLTF